MDDGGSSDKDLTFEILGRRPVESVNADEHLAWIQVFVDVCNTHEGVGVSNRYTS
jgi:hypothetical protein